GKEIRALKRTQPVDPVGDQNVATATLLPIVFSADGKSLVAGYLDGLIYSWNLADGKPLRPIRAHGGSIAQLTFHPDGKTLLSSGGDGLIRIWDRGTGKGHGRFKVTGERAFAPEDDVGRDPAFALSPDGRMLATLGLR